MTAKLRALMQRAETWPEEAQEQLVQAGLEIEAEQKGAYFATPDELQAIDDALAEVARGEIASAAEVKAAFAKFRR